MASSVGSIGLFVLLFALQSQLRFGDWPESRPRAPIGVEVDEGSPASPTPHDPLTALRRRGREPLPVAVRPAADTRRRDARGTTGGPARRRAYLLADARTRDVGGGGDVVQEKGDAHDQNPVAGGRDEVQPPVANVPASQPAPSGPPRATAAAGREPSPRRKPPKPPKPSGGPRHPTPPAHSPAAPRHGNPQPTRPHPGARGRGGAHGRPGH